MYKSIYYKCVSIGLLLGIFFLSTAVEAGSKARRGTAGAQELLMPLGSKGTAMSGAYVAGITGVEAAHWNIAGLGGMEGNGEAMFSQSNWIAGIDMSYGIVATSVGANMFGVSLKSFNFGDIPVTTSSQPDGTGEMYSPRFFTLGAMYARRVTDRIRFGTEFKIVNESIMRETATGFAVDAGVQYNINNIQLGASIRNLGTNMKFSGSDLDEFHQPDGTDPGTPNEPRQIGTSQFEMPTTFEMGVAYNKSFSGNDVILAASFLNNNFSFDEYRFGAEVKTMGMLYLRGGMAFAQDPEPFGDDGIEGTTDDSDDVVWEQKTEDFIWGPSFGFGLDFSKLLGVGLSVDYAYRSAEFFSGVSWLSLNFAF
ncbi:MAG: PorV/PorQ family protein [Candidatus Marinimicrobia bacterium]|nr:PorV/PorQ family protein [Candidatus Neomarinimicrobiota bacterium]